MKKKNKIIDVILIQNEMGNGYRAKIDAKGREIFAQEIDSLLLGKHKSLTLTRERILLKDWENATEFEGW